MNRKKVIPESNSPLKQRLAAADHKWYGNGGNGAAAEVAGKGLQLQVVLVFPVDW